MTIHLPAPIASYFDADKTGSADAVAGWFTEDAVVKDEGREHHGRDAVRDWKTGAAQSFSYVVEPFAMVCDGDQTIVNSHLTGDFPGNPVDLRYIFTLSGDKIAALEIRP